MSDDSTEIRTILAPLVYGNVLVPQSVVAEVISHQPLSPLKKTPVWILGELEWNGWHIPVISYTRLMSRRIRDPVTKKSRILVLKTLLENAPMHYIGVLVQGLPKLAKIGQDSLSESSHQKEVKGVFREVELDGQRAVIPDLDQITRMTEEAAYSR